MLKHRIRFNGLLLLTALCFSFFTQYFFHQTGDDSYIYFRYVERALAGHFGSWSDGVKPAEGFSSVLWYLLLIFLAKAGIPIITGAKCLGILFALLSLHGIYRLARLLGAGSESAMLACFLFSINTGFYYWSTSGLETAMYIALCLYTAIAMMTGRCLVFMLALVGVARPEGLFLVFALIISYQIVSTSRLSLVGIVLCLLPVFAWCLFRLSYYGLPLPNTYYAKATGDKAEQVMRGLFYILPVVPALCTTWLILVADYKKELLIALGMANWLLVFIVSGGGDWMLHFRLLLPVIALLLAIIAAQLSLSAWKARTLLLISLITLLPLSVYPTDWVKAFQRQALDQRLYQEGTMTAALKELADRINDRYQKKPLLIAVNHAGALPYWLPDDNFIDMVGLNNQTIAMAPGNLHEKYDVDYVLSKSPDLVVLNTRIEPGTVDRIYSPGYWVGETALYQDPRFLQHYRFSGLSYKWLWQIPMPYQLIFKGFPESWVLLYERRPDGKENRKK